MHDLIGHDKNKIADVLAPRGYSVEIPPYQRSYVWGKKKVRQLFRDLCGSPRWFTGLNEDEPQGDPYFMGVMVIAKSSEEPRRTVIDGQQRLTTFALILRAIELEYHRKDYHAPDQLASLLRTQARNVLAAILKLRGDDAITYTKLVTAKASEVDDILKQKRPNAITSSFLACRKEVRAQLKRAQDQSLARDAALGALYDRFTRDPYVVVLTADSESYGFALFETLNAKGEPLTPAELTKNKLLSALASDSSRSQEAIESWKRVESDLETKRVVEKFLATFWTSKEGYVSKGHLYQAICESLDGTSATAGTGRVQRATELLGALSSTSGLYAVIVNPERRPPKGPDLSIATRNRLHRINYVGAESLRPLLLAVFARLPEQADGVIELLESISVRQSVLRGRFNTLFDVYCEIAQEVWSAPEQDGEYNVVENLVDALQWAGIDFSDNNAFREALEGWDVRHPGKAARAILLAINSRIQGGEVRYHSPSDNNVEHILPIHSTAEVLTESGVKAGKSYDELVRRLGNLTVWAERDNKGSQDDSFSKKKPLYQKSALAVTRDVGRLDLFTAAQVRERSQALAEAAVEAIPWKWAATGRRMRRASTVSARGKGRASAEGAPVGRERRNDPRGPQQRAGGRSGTSVGLTGRKRGAERKSRRGVWAGSRPMID